MKHTHLAKPLIVLFTCLALFACKTDDDTTTQSATLIGIWQRGDVSDQFEYRLTFQVNNSGFRSVSEVNDKGQGISSLRTFNWMVNESTLTFDYGEEGIEMTSFNFNSDGDLLLTDLTDLHFVNIEE